MCIGVYTCNSTYCIISRYQNFIKTIIKSVYDLAQNRVRQQNNISTCPSGLLNSSPQTEHSMAAKPKLTILTRRALAKEAAKRPMLTQEEPKRSTAQSGEFVYSTELALTGEWQVENNC
ncbi:hypothetical protein XENOCAPTIV_016430 [Xenoophorus captivus]|uniref:Uncharacterized protein n=1 Tax=Xenoophorus captivus TaxID=1517983 RepID=A0ABV0RJ03_9TELE